MNLQGQNSVHTVKEPKEKNKMKVLKYFKTLCNLIILSTRFISMLNAEEE